MACGRGPCLVRPSHCTWNVRRARGTYLLFVYILGGDILILPNPGNSPVHDVSCRGVGGLETGARGSIFLREGWCMVAKASEPSEATVPYILKLLFARMNVIS